MNNDLCMDSRRCLFPQIPRSSKVVRISTILLLISILIGYQTIYDVKAATITVTNLNDNGPGSLRQAIATAASGDTIDFNVTGTIFLTTGQLSIDKDLIIIGPGMAQLIISGNDASRVFDILSGPYDIGIYDLTIADGNAGDGSGLRNQSTGAVALENVTFINNTASSYGGGMFNYNSNPTLTNVTFTNNTATTGGGMYVEASSPILDSVAFTDNTAPVGGGMANYDFGNPTLIDVSFRGNDGNVGGAMYNDDSNPSLIGGMIISNTANVGGGVYNYRSSPSLTGVTLSVNTASSGGGMYNTSGSASALDDVTFSANTASTGSGGGMYNYNSNPTLINVRFSGNTAPDGDGGGMLNYDSSPTLNNVTFSNNTADSYGGGMNNFNSYPTLENVTFDNNAATTGGGMYNEGCSPTLTSVVFLNNTAPVGGGMANYDLGDPILIDSSFTGNDGNVGGAMYNDDSSPALTGVTISSNTANVGGGIYNYQSSPTLAGVTISNNSAGSAGGIYNYQSSPTLTGVTLNDNSASRGNAGGMSNAWSNPTLTKVTFDSNVAATYGGGMSNYDSSPTLINVTFSNNAAGTYGGAINGNFDSNPILTFVTISGNTAGADGGGIYSESVTTPTLRSTILAGNSAGSLGPDCYGTINSANYNLIGDPSNCSFTPQPNDQVGINPLLAALADNGGETQTMALLSGSPAINQIPFGVLGCGTTIIDDQRGESRPYPASEYCDTGAYEYQPPSSLPDTGFLPGKVTILPEQPAEKNYAVIGDLWLEIPELGIQASIVGVPAVGNGWDASWLGRNVGYLQGSAFPTREGNTVLTAHVWDSYNHPGLFINLKQLRYGNLVKIHAWGFQYIYVVQQNKLVLPGAVNDVFQHKEMDWVTLVTCERYQFTGEGYTYRRMVRAVLVDIIQDR